MTNNNKNNNKKCRECHKPIDPREYRDEKFVQERAKRFEWCQACIDKNFEGQEYVRGFALVSAYNSLGGDSAMWLCVEALRGYNRLPCTSFGGWLYSSDDSYSI